MTTLLEGLEEELLYLTLSYTQQIFPIPKNKQTTEHNSQSTKHNSISQSANKEHGPLLQPYQSLNVSEVYYLVLGRPKQNHHTWIGASYRYCTVIIFIQLSFWLVTINATFGDSPTAEEGTTPLLTHLPFQLPKSNLRGLTVTPRWKNAQWKSLCY